jgi:predicted RNase H-like HicB family nuclease
MVVYYPSRIICRYIIPERFVVVYGCVGEYKIRWDNLSLCPILLRCEDYYGGFIIMPERFTVIIEEGLDGYLISEVVGLPGCHSQGKTYDELLGRTKEAIALYMECDEFLKLL